MPSTSNWSVAGLCYNPRDSSFKNLIKIWTYNMKWKIFPQGTKAVDDTALQS